MPVQKMLLAWRSACLVGLGQAQLGEHTAGNQQAGGVGGGVVGEADLQAELGQLVRVGGGHDHITGDGGVHCARFTGARGAHRSDALFGVRCACRPMQRTHAITAWARAICMHGVTLLTNLAGDVLGGEADHQAVLVGVILVLVLLHQAKASPVVGLARTTALVLDLEAAEVGRVLDNVRRGRRRGCAAAAREEGRVRSM